MFVVYEITEKVCSLCGQFIDDNGLCSFDCSEDAELERSKVIFRRYRITRELLEEWKYDGIDNSEKL